MLEATQALADIIDSRFDKVSSECCFYVLLQKKILLNSCLQFTFSVLVIVRSASANKLQR